MADGFGRLSVEKMNYFGLRDFNIASLKAVGNSWKHFLAMEVPLANSQYRW